MTGIENRVGLATRTIVLASLTVTLISRPVETLWTICISRLARYNKQGEGRQSGVTGTWLQGTRGGCG